MFVGEFETLADDLAEVLFVEDQVVGRGDDHLRVGILLQQRVGRIGDAGGRIAADRFADFGDVFEYEVLVFMVGHDEKVLGGDDFCKAFVSVADKRFACSQYVEKLLGHRLPAFGPEARTDAAGHDDAIGMFVHDELLLRFVFE